MSEFYKVSKESKRCLGCYGCLFPTLFCSIVLDKRAVTQSAQPRSSQNHSQDDLKIVVINILKASLSSNCAKKYSKTYMLVEKSDI